MNARTLTLNVCFPNPLKIELTVKVLTETAAAEQLAANLLTQLEAPAKPSDTAAATKDSH